MRGHGRVGGHRHRRRQLLARREGRRGLYRAHPRRPHGHAGHGYELHGHGGRAGAEGRGRPGADGAGDPRGGGAVHPRQSHPASGKGTRGHLRLRHRLPVLLHRHGGGSPCGGDRGRRDIAGQEHRRRVRQRPGQERRCRQIRHHHLRRGAQAPPGCDGLHRHQPVHG